MHCFSQGASDFRKISISAFTLVSVTLIPACTGTLYAAVEPALTFEALHALFHIKACALHSDANITTLFFASFIRHQKDRPIGLGQNVLVHR